VEMDRKRKSHSHQEKDSCRWINKTLEISMKSPKQPLEVNMTVSALITL
jgi:hypothetical protein